MLHFNKTTTYFVIFIFLFLFACKKEDASLNSDNASIQLAANLESSFFITKTHVLFGTGSNSNSELGIGSISGSNTPVKIMENVKSVSPGLTHTLILKTDNSLWATGSNSSGQLGDGTTVDKKLPVHIIDGVESIAAGAGISFIVKPDHSLWFTGADGTLNNPIFPVKIMDNVLKIATRGTINKAVVIKTDHTLWLYNSPS